MTTPIDFILTLVAPAVGGLCAEHVSAACAALQEQQANPSPPHWLSDQEACDIAFGACLPEVAEAVVRQSLHTKAIDLFVQPAEDRRKLLLVADMDSTMVPCETVDELAGYAGLKEEVALITARSMRGELDFEQALRERVRMLKGLPETVLEETIATLDYMPGAKTLIGTMRANGATCLLVSGGFTPFTRHVARVLGFNAERANTLHRENGVLTGTVGEPIVDHNAKVRTLIEEAARLRLPMRKTLAVGDGANDVAMIQAAGLGVAYHAKPVVRAAARWRIDHGTHEALLFAQGYRRADFVD